MNPMVVRDLNEQLEKTKISLKKSLPSSATSGKGIEIIESFCNDHGGVSGNQGKKLDVKTIELFTGYLRILKHYFDDLSRSTTCQLSRDHFTISIVLFQRSEDHSIAMVQKAIKRARLVLNDAQKDKRHWLWREGLLK